MDFDGYLVKFKYISYIGEMVKSKLSYKYIMNCIKNDRLDKMLFTLPEEVREEAYRMVDVVKAKTRAALLEGTYKPLYTLYSEDMEGSKGYFTQVCRTYWREHVIPDGLDEARRIGLACSCHVEGSPMIHRSPNDWKAEGDIHTTPEIKYLRRDMTLIMILRHNRVKFPVF